MGQVTRTQFGCTKTVTLTNAEIIAASVAAIEIVPGVSGKILVPVLGILRFDWVADMGDVDAAIVVNVDVNAQSPSFDFELHAYKNADVLFASGSSQFLPMFAEAPYNTESLAVADYAGLPLQLFIDNNGTPLSGGDPGNRLIVQVDYLVI